MLQKSNKQKPRRPREWKSSWTNGGFKRKGTFQILPRGESSCPQEMAIKYHLGLVGLTVAAQLPLVDAEPDQHPIDQLQKALETAWGLKEAIIRLGESLAKGTETAQQPSDRCHLLHT